MCQKEYIPSTYDVSKQSEDTALAKHIKNTNHNFNFNNISILAFENNIKNVDYEKLPKL